jgi:hypothetical protein
MTRDALRHGVLVARAWRVHVALTLFLCVTVALWAAPSTAEMPQLRSVEIVRAPSASIAALVATLGVLLTLDEPITIVPRTSARDIVRFRRGRVVVLTLVALTLMLAVDRSHPASTVTALTALVGEGLLCRAVAGPELSWLLPSGHLLASATFGATPQRDVSPWAWIVSVDAGAIGVAVAVAVLVLGLAVWGPRVD